jgi:5-(carboxyamino)imidazole ribonucleotide synthase
MPILPGKTIGILGGGQLGRMFAIAARRMGYYVHAFDPTRYGPTGQIADVEVNSAYDDLTAARRFAQGVDIVTFEFENVPSETLAEIEKIVPVHPSPYVLDTCRHRLHEKEFLSRNGFPVAPYRKVENADELRHAIAALGTPCILKTAEFGYDGKGQTTIHSPDQADTAWKNLKAPVGVLEGFIHFDKEISVICARTESGQTRCFDVAENHHEHHILDVTTVPAGISPKLAQDAIDLATAITSKLNVVGLLAVEMFVVGEKVLVNELAPRPHNSGHFSFDACVTSQFEQQLRAVCELPLGETTLLKPVAMANLLGDLWSNGEPNWAAALANPAVKLHLYGKAEPKPGRKMGHLTAMAETAREARDIVLNARKALSAR